MDYPDFSDKEMPYSLEAEQTILGSILIDQSVISVVLEKIRPDCFYNEQHRKLFNIMLRMFTSGIKADIITVLNEALKENIFETAQEGRNYLAALVNMVPSVDNVDSYCQICAEKYYIRSLAITARELLHEIALGQEGAQLLLDTAEQKIFDIRQGRDVQGLTPISDVIFEAYNRLQMITGPDRDKYLGAKTGFTLLDTITTGLNRSDLIILAARPGMGKTSFALNITLNFARHSNGKEAAVFSLEMSKEQLATRLLSTEALVDSNKLRSGHISNDDWTRLGQSADVLGGMPIYIDDTSGVSVPKIKAKLRRMKNIGLVVIDYLQLMESTIKSENQALRVSEITRNLKILAKELDVPVILLSQLNRGVESRTDKRPLLSDLRDSGSIEQDADIVMFLYRDAYYNSDSKEPNISECIVAKNRHGETGKVNLIWDGQYTRFSNADFDTGPEE
ncbi:MAG: replicative DNA helicase [Clostridium sp.]|nr:replicative DNA helicase [Clostridium sp.]MCM1548106.1 replicative DNA helicase [Ruminococcus sp.]